MDEVAWALNIAGALLQPGLPRRWNHVQGVAWRAHQAGALFTPSDAELLIASAALHDVGYAESISVTGFHALDGARYLRSQGFSHRLCGLVAHHSCAYREAELRGLAAEMVEWEDEETPLRDALWWADMTTTPDGGMTNVHDRIEEIQNRYGAGDLITFFIRQARRELVAAVERTEARLRTAGISYTAK